MSENLNWLQKMSNRFFAVPTVAQTWAKLTAGRADAIPQLDSGIPFHRLGKRLSTSRFALITTGGVHLKSQPPFDMENPDGDPSFREVPLTVDLNDLAITHKYYDHRDADEDVNVIFPLDHFRQLADQGVIGELAPRHFGFMGHIDGPLVARLMDGSAPQVARMLKDDAVDAVLLTPA